MNFVQNILWNSVEGFVEAGTRTVGGYAGDALIKAGDMIESSGRGVGNSIERAAGGYGNKIGSQGYQSAQKALPSTAKKPAVKRSNSSPAVVKSGPTSKVPLGGNKYPGGKGMPSAGGAQKQITSGAKSVTGGLSKTTGGVGKSVGGVVGGGQKALTNGAKSLPKPYPNNVPYGTSTTPGSKSKSLPKPYSPSTTGSSYTSPYPTEKKTAVKPGAPKPFNPPSTSAGGKGPGVGIGGGKDGPKPYPGTTTVPGHAGRTPVQLQKQTYKGMGAERLKAPAEKGKAEHIAGFG